MIVLDLDFSGFYKKINCEDWCFIFIENCKFGFVFFFFLKCGRDGYVGGLLGARGIAPGCCQFGATFDITNKSGFSLSSAATSTSSTAQCESFLIF